jgi:hypothetical protein
MKRQPCKVCDNPLLRKMVDPLLDEQMSYAGISRYAADAGIDLSADVIARHAKHYEPPPEKPKGTPKRDFAILIRDKAYEEVENGGLTLDNKNLVPGINAGLKAQGIIDGREKVKSKQANAELAFAIIAMLGGGQPEPLQIEDGNTIDGEYEDLDGEAE